MSSRANPFHTGRLQGVVYDFDTGDGLPMHRHTELDVHITIVARGSFRVHGPEIGDNAYKAGAVIDFTPGIDHEIIALEDSSRVINILKN